MKRFLITNNPLVVSEYPQEHVRICESYMDVLVAARDAIHNGARLVMHPQAGSIKPYETPYRSLVLCEGAPSGALDFDALKHIESAIERFESLTKSMGMRSYDKGVLRDFQRIDAGLVKSCMASIGT